MTTTFLWNNLEYSLQCGQVWFLHRGNWSSEEILQEQFRRCHQPWSRFTLFQWKSTWIGGQDDHVSHLNEFTASLIGLWCYWLVRLSVRLTRISLCGYLKQCLVLPLWLRMVVCCVSFAATISAIFGLTDIYTWCEVYLTASTSEGFGLTLWGGSSGSSDDWIWCALWKSNLYRRRGSYPPVA